MSRHLPHSVSHDGVHALRLVSLVLFPVAALFAFLRSLHFDFARSYALFNSDAFYPYAFARDLLDGARMSGWSVPPAPAWVPDLILAFWGVALTDALGLSPFYAIYITGALSAALLVFVYVAFFAALRSVEPTAPAPGPAALWPAGWIFLAGATVFDGSLFPWLLVPSFHVGAFLFWPVLGALSVRLLSRLEDGEILSARGRMLLITLGLTGFAGTLSDLFFLLYAWLPLALAVPLCWGGKRGWRVSLAWFGGALLVVFAALVFESVFVDRWLVLAQAQPNFKGAVSTRGLLAFFEYVSAFFAGVPPHLGVLFAAACLLAGLVAWRGSGVLRFFAMMFVFQAGFVLAGSFLANYTRGVETTLYRYLVYLFPAALFFLWYCAIHAWRFVERAVPVLCGLGAALVIVLELFVLPRPAGVRPAHLQLAQCLDSNRERLGATGDAPVYGLADYWQAKNVSFLSERDVRLRQVTFNLAIAHWNSNFWWYDLPDGAGYTFVLPKDLDRAGLAREYGEAVDTFDCAGFEVLVYDRTNRLFETFPKHLLAPWLRATGRER